MSTQDPARTDVDASEFWENRYRTGRGEDGRMWSGRVNATVEAQVAGLSPGNALELGCGEGADALWLAARGWTVTAVDLSAAALEVAALHAEREGLAERVTWQQADLTTWRPTREYDLVTSAFMHSPVAFPREDILRRALSAVAPGGRLLIVGHAESPPGSGHDHDHDRDAPPLPTADEVLASLELGDDWVVETNATVERAVTWRGHDVTLRDAVVRVRRRTVSGADPQTAPTSTAPPVAAGSA